MIDVMCKPSDPWRAGMNQGSGPCETQALPSGGDSVPLTVATPVSLLMRMRPAPPPPPPMLVAMTRPSPPSSSVAEPAPPTPPAPGAGVAFALALAEDRIGGDYACTAPYAACGSAERGQRRRALGSRTGEQAEECPRQAYVATQLDRRALQLPIAEDQRAQRGRVGLDHGVRRAQGGPRDRDRAGVDHDDKTRLVPAAARSWRAGPRLRPPGRWTPVPPSAHRR